MFQEQTGDTERILMQISAGTVKGTGREGRREGGRYEAGFGQIKVWLSSLAAHQNPLESFEIKSDVRVPPPEVVLTGLGQFPDTR